MLAGARRAGHRSAGRRHAHLYLHLHDGQLPDRGPAGMACRSSSAIGRIRSAARRSKGRCSEPGFESFVGQYPIPMRHGMTIGELARLFNEHFGIGAKLEVVTMRGWTRDQHFDATGCRGCCRRRTSRRSTAPSSIRGPCCSKARTSRKAAARRGRSSWSARRGPIPSALPRPQRARSAGRAIPSGARSSRRSTSTRSCAVRRLPDPRHRSRRPFGRSKRASR